MVSREENDILVNLGFADKPNPKLFHPEKFPSKIGGFPVMLFPIDNKYFACSFCNGKLTFLLQLYSIIETNPNCYHRMLYIFFCNSCYLTKPAFRCFRLQLPEKSEYYNKCKAKDIKQLLAFAPNLNTQTVLFPEYSIFIDEESPESLKFYLSIELNSLDALEELDDLESTLLNKEDNALIDKLMKDYEERNDEEEDAQISNEDDGLEKNVIDDDPVFRCFMKVIKSNSHQVVRYCRDDVNPLWYCKSNILYSKDIRCNNCGGRRIYEFQIMPYIFTLYKEIMNHDIGTIVVYTCDCNIQVAEEYVYVQRTGEKLINLTLKSNQAFKQEDRELKIQDEPKLQLIEGFGISGVYDEDGFTEVISKSKRSNL